MKKLLVFLGALASLFATDCVISDTVRTPFGGYFAGKIIVTLNSPASAQPLYSGTQTLTGWQTTIDVPASANGAVSFTLVCTDSITPTGTSYAARYQPTSGGGWAETWTPATGTTTIRAMRATTVPTPTTMFAPSQITPGTNGQVLQTSGGVSVWGSPLACATCVLTSGSYSDPAWLTGLAGSKISGAVASATAATSASTATALAANGTNCAAGTFPLGVDASGNSESCTALPTTISGTANQITASASTGAVTLSLPATITGLTSVTSTGFTGALTGNASTATALSSSVASGRMWIGQGTGVPTSDSSASWDTSIGRATFRSASSSNSVPLILSAPTGGTSNILFQPDNAAKSGTVGVDSGGNLVISNTTAGSLYLDHYSEIIFRSVSASYATRAKLTSAGNFIIGTTSDLGYGLHAANKGTNGNLLVYDQTATTGSTLAVIQAGAGQSGSILSIKNNAGSEVGGFDSTGGIFTSGNARVGAGNFFFFHGRTLLGSASDGVLKITNNAETDFNRLQFGGTTSSFPALKRSTTILQARLADDSANTQLQASRIITDQTTPAASTDACTAGAMWADASYVYACTASGVIKRATLASF